MASPQKRIFLWAVLRSVSSAMCRCMMNSGLKTQILFEYYSVAYCFGPGRSSDHYTDLDPDPRYSFENGKRAYEQPYPDKELVFAKDFCYCLDPRRPMMELIPEGYTHTFITRHPRNMVASFFKVMKKLGWEKLNPDKVGFKEQLEMLRLLQKQGHKVIVLDSDDLLDDPEGMLRAYCQAVGLEFRDSMINWGPLSEEDYKDVFTRVWEDAWFTDLKAATKLKRRPKRDVSHDEVFGHFDPETRKLVEKTIEDNMQYYLEMYNMRLVV